MSSKRILILTNRVPYPLNDGGNLAMNAMIDGYHNAGWQVYLLAMNTSRHYIKRDKLQKLYAHIYAFDTVDVDNNVNVFGIAYNFLFSRKPSHEVRFYNKAFEKKLAEVIAEFTPDVIQMESVFLASYLPEMKKRTNALNVLRMHNVEHQIWNRLTEKTTNLLKKEYFNNLATRIKKFEEKVWTQFDMLVPITDSDADIVRKGNPKCNIITVPFGIKLVNIVVNNTEEKWCAYHIGAMDWLPNEEGIKWFIQKVWPEVHLRSPDFKFYFAGRNMPGYFKDIRQDGVFCEGEVEDANIFIADKKILIVPIHSGGGIRIKILEAMAVGKLVISTDIGMQGIDAIPGKHYLQANTESQFADAIQWILDNKNIADGIANEALKLIISEYNIDDLMAKLMCSIDNLLSDNSLQRL